MGDAANFGGKVVSADRVRSTPWRVLAASSVGLAFGIAATATSSFNIFILPLTREFGWLRGDVAMAMMILNLTTIVTAPICGWLLDRFGPRQVIIPSVLLFGAGWLGLAGLDSRIWHLYLGYGFLGVAGIGTSSVAYSRLIVPWFPDRRGYALGIALAGMGIGVAVIPVIMQTVINVANWRVAYCALAALVTLPAIEGPGMRHVDGMPFGQAIRSRSAVLLFLTFPLLGLLTGAIATHLVPLLVDRGITADRASLMTSVLGISLICGRIAIGWLLDRMFAPLLMGLVIGMAVIGLVLLLASTTVLWIVVAIFLIGFAIGADGDFLSVLISRYIGLRSFSRVLGFLFSAFAFGLSFGPTIMGLSFNRTGSYSFALEVLIATTTFAIVPIALLGPYPEEVGFAHKQDIT